MDNLNDAVNYNNSIELNPEYFKVWCYKAMLLGRLEKNEEALQCFEKVISLKSTNAHAWSGKGLILELLGKAEEALKSYNRALELNPQLKLPKKGKENVQLEIQKKRFGD